MAMVTNILLIIIGLGYIIGFIGNPFLFIVFLALSLVGILLLTIILGCSLIKPRKKRVLFIGAGVFILFIVSLTIVTSKRQRYIVPSSAETLKPLSYLTWVPAEEIIEKSGVTKYDQNKSFKGINLYDCNMLRTAYLMDMSGNVLHSWSETSSEDDGWFFIEMYKNGNLLCMFEDKMLIKLDWNSNIKWIEKMRGHHDIAIAENGTIYVITRKDKIVFHSILPVPVLNDYITVLSSDGKIKKEISLFNILRNEIPFDRVSKIYLWMIKPKNLKKIVEQKIKSDFIFKEDTPFDIFHTNTIEIIDRNIEGLCEKGDLLISIRELDLIGIFNIENEKLIWSWGPGNLDRQHHPTLLENGNILIFDNGVNRGYSRVVELNPLTKKIAWEYKAKPSKSFYSCLQGACQRLPNGNTLITESMEGHVFEITEDGEIVWEFYNPNIKKG